MKKLLIIIIIALNSCLFTELGAKTGNSPDSTLSETEYLNLKKNHTYIELLGNGLLGSLNYDRILICYDKTYISARAGFLPVNDRYNKRYAQNSILEMKYTHTIANHHFISGIGLLHLPEQWLICQIRIGYRYFINTNKWFLEFSFLPINYIVNDFTYEERYEDSMEGGDPAEKFILWYPWIGVGFGISF